MTWGPVDNTPDADDAAETTLAAGTETSEGTDNRGAADKVEQAPARTD